MKTVKSWRDMEQHGITCLTGEACAYGYRILCDLTMAGEALIQECFGFRKLPVDVFHESWNRGSGSIMLAHAMLEPLAVMALFKAGCSRVLIVSEGEFTSEAIYGLEPGDNVADLEHMDWYRDGQFRVFHNPGYARNTHQMSGRKE